jgi:hypothetical protein
VRLLYEGLAEVVNQHRPSSGVLLAALELLRHQAVTPLLRRMEIED